MNTVKTFAVHGLLSSMSTPGVEKRSSRLSGVTTVQINYVAIESANVVRMKSDSFDVFGAIEVPSATLRKMYQNQWRGGLPAGCRRVLPAHDQYGRRCHCSVAQFSAGCHQRTDAQAHAARRHPSGQCQCSDGGYGHPCLRGARR